MAEVAKSRECTFWRTGEPLEYDERGRVGGCGEIGSGCAGTGSHWL